MFSERMATSIRQRAKKAVPSTPSSPKNTQFAPSWIVSPIEIELIFLDHGENPFDIVPAQGWEVDGKGHLGHIQFGGGDDYARKSLADPDMVSLSWVHQFDSPANVGDSWKEAFIEVGSDILRFNHYAFLSQEEARRKSELNKNPFMNFNPDIDEFFSREQDTEIHHYLPELKSRLLSVIHRHPPVHLDDWSPATAKHPVANPANHTSVHTNRTS